MSAFQLARIRLSYLSCMLFLVACKPVVRNAGNGSRVVKLPPAPLGQTPQDGTLEKLDPALRALAEAARAQEGSASAALQPKTVPLEDGRVRVKITVQDRTQMEETARLVKELNGTVVTQLANVLFVLLPPARLESVAAAPAVWNMTVPAEVVTPQAGAPR